MNKVYQSGRIIKDPEIINASSGIKIAKFTIAVRRKYKNEQGEYDSDFFNCSAFRASADYMEKYVKKGCFVNICGRLENRCYETNGEKKYYTEIVVDEIENCTTKTNVEKEITNGNLTPINDEDIPF